MLKAIIGNCSTRIAFADHDPETAVVTATAIQSLEPLEAFVCLPVITLLQKLNIEIRATTVQVPN